jgi:hypothetical protein
MVDNKRRPTAWELLEMIMHIDDNEVRMRGPGWKEKELLNALFKSKDKNDNNRK